MKTTESIVLETILTRVLCDDPLLGALCSARLHIMARRPAEAERVLRALIERAPDLAEAHYLLGTVHRAAFRNFDAMRCCREALRIDPEHERAGFELDVLFNVQEP